MKKTGKKLLVTASLVSTAVTMGGCKFLPWLNSAQAVYGPPPDDYVTMTLIPEEFRPEENVSAGVYGPPPDMELVTPTPEPEEEEAVTEE